MKAQLISILALVLSGSALAGHEIRNGGNAVVCYEGPLKRQVVSVELFDFWEGRNFYPSYPVVDLGDETVSVGDKVGKFIERVATYDPERADRYRDYASLLLGDLSAFLVDVIPGNPVDDDTPLGLPTAPCFKEQFAVQIRDPLPNQRRFEIRRDLYENAVATNDARAGILIHEIAYRDAIDHDGHTKSDGTRRFVYFNSTSRGLVADAVERKEVYDMANISFATGSEPVRLLPSGKRILVTGLGSETARLATPDHFSFPSIDFTVTSGPRVSLKAVNGGYSLENIRSEGVYTTIHFDRLKLNGKTYASSNRSARSFGMISFYPSGQPATLPERSIQEVVGSDNVRILAGGLDQACDISRSPLELDENGFVMGCATGRATTLTAHLPDGSTFTHGCRDGQACYSSPEVFGDWLGDYISFYPNGNLKRAGAFTSTVRLMGIGASNTYSFSGVFVLTEDGKAAAGQVDIPVAAPVSTTLSALIRWDHGQYRTYGGGYSRYVIRNGDAGLIASSGLATIRNYCGDRFPTELANIQLNQSSFRKTVTGTENLYDLDLKKYVAVTDEPVVYYPSIACPIAERTIALP